MTIVKRMPLVAAALIFALSTLTVGCATDIGGSSYSDDHVGEASKSVPGRVIKVRQVKVGPDQLGKSKTGATIGAVSGALLGSTMGGGSGKTLMAIGGGIAGAVGGAYAEKALKTQTAFEITVKLRNGEYMTVVQGADTTFQKGENVLVVVSHRGRSKVVKFDDDSV